MKILFVSLHDINSISDHGLYSDLLREFAKNGHSIVVVSPVERRTGKKGEIIEEGNVTILKVRIGNIQKTNYIEKGISTLLLDSQLIKAIRKNCMGTSFDVILYATPPVTIYGLIKKIKNLSKATTCLMLKDIWPQEMVDLNIIKPKGLLYRYFLRKEEKLYSISDLIGYTSNANKQYLISRGISEGKLIAINNSVDPSYHHASRIDRSRLLQKYGVNDSQIVFFYGGNLGKPQDIDFLVQCLKSQINLADSFFILCGQGTDYSTIEIFFEAEHPSNMILLPFLPKEEYDQLIMSSDVGMVFLNHKFTVPNCPSRFYTYMEYGKPIFACTDTATDIKDDIRDGDFGWWCESKDPHEFEKLIEVIKREGKQKIKERGNKARAYLEQYYTVDKDYCRIIEALKDGK